MRKNAAAGILGIVALALAGCGEPQPLGGDRLFVQTGRGVAIVDSGGGAPAFQAASAIPSHDWTTVVTAQPGEESTRIAAVNPSSGVELWSQAVPGKLKVKALSRDGNVAVLESAGQRYRNSPTITRFVIARAGAAEAQTIELKGNFAPEALSTDAQNLFVVQYLPARNPNRYQVRRLDLSTGKVHDVFTVDAELQESMRGTARIQAMSADGSRLYTLYTMRSNGSRYAFIHVLALDEGELWAHCVDLPPEFAHSPESATALTVSPDGTRLYVANAREKVLAEIDTEKLAVARTATVDFGLEWSEGAHAAHGSGSTLYLASGPKVVAVDAGELAVTESWDVTAPVSGLQEGTGATKLYVGQGLRITVLDLVTGDILGRIDPPGIGAIGKMGKVIRALDDIRTEIVCAC